MMCEKNLAWDNTIPSDNMKVWDKWESSLIQKIEIPRSIVQSNSVTKIDLHVFCDSSKTGSCAEGYIVAHHPKGSSQGLIASKSCLAKQNTTIPRLELIVSHMASNLVQNLKEAFSNYNVREIFGWTESTVVPHWPPGNGEYKQFVSNRIRKVKSRGYIHWSLVPTNENPADIGSRGCPASKIPELRFQGPKWLPYKDQ